LAVECKKTFLDIIYGFPVIVMRRVAAFKENTLAKNHSTINHQISTTEKHPFPLSDDSIRIVWSCVFKFSSAGTSSLSTFEMSQTGI
jgi:hypothetical protein